MRQTKAADKTYSPPDTDGRGLVVAPTGGNPFGGSGAGVGDGARVIVYAWVNDEQTLRSSGSKSDPYAVFEKMLGRGNPPDDWNALVLASKQDWSKLE